MSGGELADAELLAELMQRLALSHGDYAELEAKYKECVTRLHKYQVYQYQTQEQLNEYVEQAGWNTAAIPDNVMQGLRGVVEAYLRHVGLVGY